MRTEQLAYAAARYGAPLYLFDLDALRQETERFRKCLGEQTGLCFAMKANPFLTSFMADMTDRIEICSMGEFRICRELGIPPKKMLISGVMKKDEDIREILDFGGGRCAYTVESLNQLRYFREWGMEKGEVLHLYLRLTSGNQFGMDEQTIEDIIDVAKEWPFLKIEGIHYFSGTQKKSLRVIEKEVRYLDGFLKGLKEKRQFEVRELEYGAGIAVPYFQGKEEETFQDEGIRKLSELFSGMEWKGQVTVELGRALTAMCGYYLTEIRDVKQTGDTGYCIVDGGCHQMNYDGQIKGMYQPWIRAIPERAAGEARDWVICGALCTANDVLCRKLRLRDIKVGDILAFERAGAYSVTEGMALFLSHDLPKVVLYGRDFGWKLVRDRKFTYEWNIAKEAEDGYINEDFRGN